MFSMNGTDLIYNKIIFLSVDIFGIPVILVEQLDVYPQHSF